MENIQPTDKPKMIQNRIAYKYEDGWAEHYKINKVRKQYYETHKDAILCDLCGYPTDKYHLKQHQRSKRCTKLMCSKTNI